MTIELSRLKTRLAQIEWQLRGYDQMIRDTKYWGALVSVAHEGRAPLVLERDLLASQIAAIEDFEIMPCERLHS